MFLRLLSIKSFSSHNWDQGVADNIVQFVTYQNFVTFMCSKQPELRKHLNHWQLHSPVQLTWMTSLLCLPALQQD